MRSVARRLGLVSAAVLVTSLCCAPFAMAEAGSYRLWAGETLHPGEKLVSPHAAYSLVMQPDGDLVEVSSTGRRVWASGTKSPQSVLQMQSDGNAVIYAPGHVAVWESHSAGSGAQTIEVQDDENLVLYAPGHVAVWTTGQIDPAFASPLPPDSVGPRPQGGANPSDATPTDIARYRVELKAWIPQERLYEAPPGAEICQAWVPGTKMWYEGDNHTDYTGSYRVFAAYDFLWDGAKISDLSVEGMYGTTTLHMAGPLPNMNCANTGHATKSTDVTADGNTFTLRLSAANPLQHGGPTIDSKLTATMVSADEMKVRIQTDKFPSHGFAVYKNGTPLATAVEFDASCVPNSGFESAALIKNRLQSFEHEEAHDIDLRVENQQFFGPCEKKRPRSFSFPAA